MSRGGGSRGSVTLALVTMLALGLVSAAVALGTSVVSQVSGATPNADFVTWVQASGFGGCVAALGYVVRALLTGRLVARDTAQQAEFMKDTLTRLGDLLETHQEREKAASQREDAYHRLLVKKLSE